MNWVGVCGLVLLVGSYLWLLTPYRGMFEITNLCASILLAIYAYSIHNAIFTIVNSIIAAVLALSILRRMKKYKTLR